MTYDPKRNILFLHIPKNAGKSIEAMLGMVEPADLERYQSRSLANRAATFLQRATADREARRRLFGTLDYTLCAQHLTLQEIELLGLIPTENLCTVTTIAVCRNPWDRAVSTYFHFCGHQRQNLSPTGFRTFLHEWYESPPRDHNVRAHQRPQVDFLRNLKGEIRLSVLLRFEALQEDAKRLLSSHLATRPMPHIGAAKRPSRDYREFYDAEARTFIEEQFFDDIEQFNYSF